MRTMNVMWGVIGLAGIAVATSSVLAQSEQPIFGAPVFSDVAPGVLEPATELYVKRSRYVVLDEMSLFGEGGARGVTDPGAEERLALNLFDGTMFEAVRQRIDLGLGNTPAWYGEIVGEPGGYALFVQGDGVVVGKVFSPRHGIFEIVPVGGGVAALREIEFEQAPPCGTDHRHAIGIPNQAPVEPLGRRGIVQPPSERGVESGGFIFVDVGLVYTIATRQTVGSIAAMEALLDQIIAECNIGYQNSGIDIRVRSAFKHETLYGQSGTDMGTDLSLLRGTNDGVMDEIHALRDQTGADIVTLVVNSATNACGIGYLMVGVNQAFESNAFNVVARTCFSQFTFPHELGHNMGCAHDRDNAGSASHNFAFGYRSPGATFRTIMAYAPGTRILHFSNPDVTFQGLPTGNPLNHGSNPTHNALAINLNANTIANWRTLYTQAPASFALLSPGEGELTPNRAPTFTWEEAEQTDYYSLQVDDDPAFGSPEIDVAPITGTSYTPSSTPPMALAQGVQYYWRVVANNPLGSTNSAPVASNFVAPANMPGAFTRTSPANGAINVSRNPSFQWTQSTDTDGYTLLVDNAPDFSSPEINAAGIFQNNYTWSGVGLNPATMYSWKVISTNGLGTVETTTGTFETISVAPGGFALITPSDGATVTTFTPILTWSASPFAESYELMLDDDFGFASPEIQLSGLDVTSYQVPLGVLQNNAGYFWKVRASNVVNSTNSSPTVALFSLNVPVCQGDANDDRDVNFADISAVLSNWGGSGPQGDANKDGSVNFVDISSILGQWGISCP